MDERRIRRSRHRPVSKARPLVPVPVILGAVLVAVLAVAGLIALGEFLREPPPAVVGRAPTDGAGPTPGAQQAAGEVLYDGRSKGPKDAPVEIIEYADFQCPFCGQYAQRTDRQIVETYVARGLVRVTFRHFPFLGIESRWAALAAECANEQGKFWPYHDTLFANQSGENKGAFTKDKLKGFARDLRLDTASFDACLDSDKYMSLLREQFEEGERLGVRATPTFFIGDQRLEGAQPFANFQRVIDRKLAKE
ncbi:MAG: DsbA family protein [Chloroflexi bacterium]|nr:DsbA family protein [Chloroflexota bacterium]